MNWYKRHIGDYIKDAAHLSLLEHGVYTRLLDVYYTREAGIPDDQAARLIGARTKDEREALTAVLSEFFVLQDGAWIQTRCEQEIGIASDVASTNREIALQREAKKRAEKEARQQHEASTKRGQSVQRSVHEPTTSQTPDSISHKPDTNQEKDLGGDARGDASPSAPPERKQPSDRATRIPADFELNDLRIAVATAEKLPDIQRTFAKFCDYWRAASGAKARKIDWDATWRNWCRSEADRGVSGTASRPQQPYKTKFDQAMEALDRA